MFFDCVPQQECYRPTTWGPTSFGLGNTMGGLTSLGSVYLYALNALTSYAPFVNVVSLTSTTVDSALIFWGVSTTLDGWSNLTSVTSLTIQVTCFTSLYASPHIMY